MIPEFITKDFKHLDTYMLFGSRSMAVKAPKQNFDPAIMIGEQITQSTDWDFSAPANAENHHALIAAGYTCYNHDELPYKDALTQAVYIKRFSQSGAEWPRHFMIDSQCITTNVVLRSDYALFRQTWYSIDVEFYFKYLWKRSPAYDGVSVGTRTQIICDIMNQLFATAAEMT